MPHRGIDGRRGHGRGVARRRRTGLLLLCPGLLFVADGHGVAHYLHYPLGLNPVCHPCLPCPTDGFGLIRPEDGTPPLALVQPLSDEGDTVTVFHPLDDRGKLHRHPEHGRAVVPDERNELGTDDDVHLFVDQLGLPQRLKRVYSAGIGTLPRPDPGEK